MNNKADKKCQGSLFDLSSDGLPTLKYRGYLGILRLNNKDRNRVYGSIASIDKVNTIISKDCFAGDDIDSVNDAFHNVVNNLIENEKFKKEQVEWKACTDWQTVASVFNILPEKFRERVECKIIDPAIIERVKGSDYEVPLYFVTKAWDYVLSGSLCGFGFMIQPTPSIDGEPPTKEDIAEFIAENNPKRMKEEARAQNNEMKMIWKEYFNIDIDLIEIDFNRFNMHMFPQVSHYREHQYFIEGPEGVYEWILSPVNYPDANYIFFDCVSALMEYCAYLQREREDPCYDEWE